MAHRLTGADDPRAVLRALEQRARKRFGQHFLARPSIVDRMVRVAGVRPGDRVLEIGPGLGILTEALVDAGAEVVAVEVDDDLAARIASLLPTVRVVHADATRVDWSQVCPGEGWKVVANLPYNVGTGLVTDLLRAAPRFASQTVMLQAEVVERMTAEPGTKAYGALTVEIALRGTADAVIAVPPEAFVPPPKVRSLVVHVVPHPAPLTGGLAPDAVDKVIRAAFSQRRKTLLNSLGSAVGRERAESALRRAGLDPGLRAEVLDPPAFVALAEALAGSA